MSVINLNQKKLSQLQYYILPGKPPTNFEHQELHDRAYCYWRDFWRKVFGDDESVLADDFIRQDFVPVVMLDTQIVAMHLYTVFNPESVATREHSYFKTYPPEFFDFLTERNAKRVMSIESLTVDPNWRKSQVGISLGETLIGASLKYLDALDIDANIAPTRNDRGVNKMCYNFGFDCFRSKLGRVDEFII
jgi:hypothetical protein